MKIIPAIDLMEGQVVRLYKGDPAKKTIYSNDPVDVAKQWEKEGADLIHIVDLDATLGRGTNSDLIKKIASEIAVPVQVAGGLRSEALISETIGFASRIVLGTLAFEQIELVKKLLKLYGPEKIVISVDHKDGNIVVNGWQKNTDMKLIKSIKDFTKLGFSEFLLTNVTKDGTLEGPDLTFLQKACSIPNTNIIASGGISSIDDIKSVKNTNAYGVILGKAMYEKIISIKEAKKIS